MFRLPVCFALLALVTAATTARAGVFTVSQNPGDSPSTDTISGALQLANEDAESSDTIIILDSATYTEDFPLMDTDTLTSIVVLTITAAPGQTPTLERQSGTLGQTLRFSPYATTGTLFIRGASPSEPITLTQGSGNAPPVLNSGPFTTFTHHIVVENAVIAKPADTPNFLVNFNNSNTQPHVFRNVAFEGRDGANSTVAGVNATGTGGAIFENCTFNVSGTDAGAPYLPCVQIGAGAVEFTTCTFTAPVGEFNDFQVFHNGGDSTLTMTNCTIDDYSDRGLSLNAGGNTIVNLTDVDILDSGVGLSIVAFGRHTMTLHNCTVARQYASLTSDSAQSRLVAYDSSFSHGDGISPAMQITAPQQEIYLERTSLLNGAAPIMLVEGFGSKANGSSITLVQQPGFSPVDAPAVMATFTVSDCTVALRDSQFTNVGTWLFVMGGPGHTVIIDNCDITHNIIARADVRPGLGATSMPLNIVITNSTLRRTATDFTVIGYENSLGDADTDLVINLFMENVDLLGAAPGNLGAFYFDVTNGPAQRGFLIGRIFNCTFNGYGNGFVFQSKIGGDVAFDNCDFRNFPGGSAIWVQPDGLGAPVPPNPIISVTDTIFENVPNAIIVQSDAATVSADHIIAGDESAGANSISANVVLTNLLDVASVGYVSKTFGEPFYLTLFPDSPALGFSSGNSPETFAGAKGEAELPNAARRWDLFN